MDGQEEMPVPDSFEPELWSNETIAEFHLNNAMDEVGYRWAIKEALSMGIDPRDLDPEHVFLNDTPWRNPHLHFSPAVY